MKAGGIDTSRLVLIILLVLLFKTKAAERSLSLNAISNVFVTAFSHEKINALYPTSIDLVHAIQALQDRSLRSTDSHKTRIYVGCRGKEVHLRYDTFNESKEISVLFVSEENEIQCFAIKCNPITLESYQTMHGIHIIGPMPSFLKMDLSLLKTLQEGYTSLRSLERNQKYIIRCHIKLNTDFTIADSPFIVSAWINIIRSLNREDILGLVDIPLNVTRVHISDALALSDKMGMTITKSASKLLPNNLKRLPEGKKSHDSILSLLRMRIEADSITFAAFLETCGDALMSALDYKFEGHYLEIRLKPAFIRSNADKVVPMCFSLLLAVIADDSNVIAINEAPEFKTLNDVTKGLIQTGEAHKEPFSSFGLNGSNVVVGVADTGVDSTSCFVAERSGIGPSSLPVSHFNASSFDSSRRKIIQYIDYGDRMDSESGHGSHVVGTIAGHCLDCSGTGSKVHLSVESFNGVAPASKIAFFDIGMSDGSLNVPLDVRILLGPSYSAGARIFSASWGGDYAYDGFTVSVDAYVYNHPELLFVAASGNNGGFGEHSVVSPGLAKNALTVGASLTPRRAQHSRLAPAYFSSFGPTPDGRRKPDVMAPGYSTYSIRSGPEGGSSRTCDVTQKAGTSMATPAVSGAVALIQQFFEDPSFWAKQCNRTHRLCSEGPFSPPGYLMKALILHSGDGLVEAQVRHLRSVTEELDASGEVACSNYVCRGVKEGYGIVNLANVLPVKGSAPRDLFISLSTLQSYEEHTYSMTCCSSPELKMTLSWYDPPNLEFAAVLLIHDLDLVVRDPNGTVYFGNHLFLNDGSGNNRPDAVNNNEQVLIYRPIQGEWSVSVRSRRLSHISQNFSLVVTGAVYVDDLFISSYDATNRFQWSCASRLNEYVSFDMVLFNYGRDAIMEYDWSDYVVIYSVGLETTHCLDLYSPFICWRILNATTMTEIARFPFDNEYFYNLKSVCITAGTYKIRYTRLIGGVEVDLSNTSIYTLPAAEMQTLASLPVCSTFISPLVNEQVVLFSIDHDKNGMDSELVCKSLCSSSDHVTIPLILLNGYWVGSHYTVKNLKTNLIFDGDFLELNFDKITDLCLPALPACYEVRLHAARNMNPGPVGSSSILYDDHPYLYFYDSYYYDKSVFSESEEPSYSNESCPYLLYSGWEVARICTDGYSKAYFSYGNDSQPAILFEEETRVCSSTVDFVVKSDALSVRQAANNSYSLITSVRYMRHCILQTLDQLAVTIPLIVGHQNLMDLFLDSPDLACSVMTSSLSTIEPSTFSSIDNYYENMLHFVVSEEACVYSQSDSVPTLCFLMSYFRKVCVPNEIMVATPLEERISSIIKGSEECTTAYYNVEGSITAVSPPQIYKTVFAWITGLSVILLIAAYFVISSCRKPRHRKLVKWRLKNYNDEFVLKGSADNVLVSNEVVDFRKSCDLSPTDEDCSPALVNQKRRVQIPNEMKNSVLKVFSKQREYKSLSDDATSYYS